jgi:hypothetical protein
MKDFLTEKCLQGTIGSKDATGLAFQNEIIDQGQVWMFMLQSRNKIVHTYHLNILEVDYTKIANQYFPLLTAFYTKMKP